MRDLLRRSMVLSLLVLTALSGPGKFSSSSRTSARVIDDALPRRPLGVYAKANIETLMKQKAFKNCASSPGCDIHVKFREFYARLLANPAISGLTISQHWDHIQTASDVYDFSYLDDAFTVANDKQKPVALIITPGVVSPKWLLKEIPNCTNKKGEFLGKGVDLNCGKQAFEGFPEEQRDDNNKEIPLPWNLNYQPSTYQQAWADFLRHLNDKYGSNPAFVAIAVAGPIAASDEMILPTSENDKVEQPSGLPVDEIWSRLISNSFPDGRYATNPNQAFVDAWKTTIGTYESIFSGITLTLSPDGGTDLPELEVTPPDDPRHLFEHECKRTPTPLSCKAKTEVIEYFMNATCLTSLYCVNGKATRVGGLTASSKDSLGNIGIAGVKLLTSWPPPPSPPLLGGAEFDHPVSGKNMQQTGCPDYDKNTIPPTICSGLSVEGAAYNVMASFFNHTPAAPYFIGTVSEFQKGTPGAAPMQYLEVPFRDVEYANTHQCVSTPSDVIGYMSFQQMLNQAQHDLLGIADGTLPAEDSTPPVTTTILPAPTGLHGWYQGPTVVDFSATDDLSGVVMTEWSLDNQATWTPFACDPLHLRDDGVYNVLSCSTDLAGKVEVPKLTVVKIDSTAPVTTVSTYTVRGKRGPISVVVSFAASDNLSGVARTEYSLDNGSHWTIGTSIALNESGTYTILFRSIDVAGNVEKRNSIKLNVNVNPPTQPH